MYMHVPTVDKCKWGYAKTTLFIDITTVLYYSPDNTYQFVLQNISGFLMRL